VTFSPPLLCSAHLCPVRCVKFIARKQWIIAAADDMNIRVYNYNTMECIKKWEAHSDYIRSIAIHPTQPYVLTCSDDMSIKLWNWDREWSLMRIFEGHTHYVMMVRRLCWAKITSKGPEINGCIFSV